MIELTAHQQNRVNYYLGNLRSYRHIEVEFPEIADAFVVTKDTTPEQFALWLRSYSAVKLNNAITDRKTSVIYEAYIEPVVAEIAGHPALADFAYPVLPFDNWRERKRPMLVKSRQVDTQSPIAMMQLNLERHWRQHFGHAKKTDRPFEEKADRLVFRGAITGRWRIPDGEPSWLSARYHLSRRLRALQGDAYDLGFTEGFEKLDPEMRADLEAAGGVVERLDVEGQLACKYLLSLEGNDVASGLKWMMTSNSVVFAPRPRVASWLMEDRMVPWEHYVPVEFDLTDVEEKMDWCRAHPDEAKAIAENATQYMRDFRAEKRQTTIRAAVYRAFAEKVRVVVEGPVYDGIGAENLVKGSGSAQI